MKKNDKPKKSNVISEYPVRIVGNVSDEVGSWIEKERAKTGASESHFIRQLVMEKKSAIEALNVSK